MFPVFVDDDGAAEDIRCAAVRPSKRLRAMGCMEIENNLNAYRLTLIISDFGWSSAYSAALELCFLYAL